MEYERIPARHLRAGDRVSHTLTEPFERVVETQQVGNAVDLHGASGTVIAQTSLDALWFREVRPHGSPA